MGKLRSRQASYLKSSCSMQGVQIACKYGTSWRSQSVTSNDRIASTCRYDAESRYQALSSLIVRLV